MFSSSSSSDCCSFVKTIYIYIYIYTVRKKERENVESDSNDDSESQSIDINAITIDNNASDDVASRTRSKMTIKARNERARLDKTQKRSQNIPSRSLTSKDGSIEY